MPASLGDEILKVREKARLEGLLEGRMEVAVKMLERGLAISLISDTTGVSEERLRELAGGRE